MKKYAHDAPKLKGAHRKLRALYKKIPSTTGCMDNLDTCKSWCCLLPDVRVVTPSGMVPVSDIKKGDSVFTKSGIQKVVRTVSRTVKKEIVKIETRYGRSMKVTADHLVLVDSFSRKAREKPSDPQWVKAIDLLKKKDNNPGHYIIFPKIKYKPYAEPDFFTPDMKPGTISIPFSLKDDCYFDGEYCYASKHKRGKAIYKHIDLDYDFLWIWGLYLAEGSTSRFSVDFHISTEEPHLLDRIEAFADRMNLYCSWKINRGKSLTVRIFSSVIARFFKYLGGSGCENKKINDHNFSSILQVEHYTKAIHDGYYAGDGYKKLSAKRSYSATTTSKELTYQLILINLMQNRFVGICNGKPKNKKEFWTLSDSNGKFHDYVETDDDFRVPVRKIETEYYEGLVYDIEVEEGGSFSTECGEVHNCSNQTPQVLYVEFLHTWKDIIKYWAIPDILDLIENAVNAYLNNNPVKGCIFHNKDTGLCTQHETRCFNCYIYGITPKDRFTKRFNKFKEMYKDRPDVILHDQCPLVVPDKKVTQKDIDKWWNELVGIEKSIGIKKNKINDKDDGSYRSYHDHLLLHLFPDVVLNQMTIVKGTIKDLNDREACVRSLMECLKGNIESILNGEADERNKKD